MNAMKKTLAALALAAAVGGPGYYYYAHASRAATGAVAATPVKVERGNIFQLVSSTGTVASNLDVEIKCKAGGQIVKLTKDVSDPVKEGELLIQVDTLDQDRAVRQAQAQVAASKAKWDQSEFDVKVSVQALEVTRMKAEAGLASATATRKDAESKALRRKELLEQKLASQEDYETARTTADQAKASEDLARSQVADVEVQRQALDLKREAAKLAHAQYDEDAVSLEIANQKKADATVVSPVSGVVSALTVQKGQMMASALTNTGGGTSAMIISDLSRLFVLATVDESDIGNIHEGQDAWITADAFPGRRFKGKVTRIATKGVNVSNVVTFEVKIEVLDDEKNPKGLLKPQMTANVNVVTAKAKDVLLVPQNALVLKDGKRYAMVKKEDGGTEEREVKTGLNNGDNWEVREGLKEGETVVARKDEAASKWAGGPRPGGNTPGGPPGGGRR